MDTTDTTLEEASPNSLLHSAVEDKKILGQYVSHNTPQGQCVGHNTLQGQPAVTEQSNWDGTMEKYTAVQ